MRFEPLDAGQTLLSAPDENGNGIALTTNDRGTMQLLLRGPFAPVTKSPYLAPGCAGFRHCGGGLGLRPRGGSSPGSGTTSR